MKPGSQGVLDLVEAHLNENLPTELQAYVTTVNDNLAWRPAFDERTLRTWSKRMVVDLRAEYAARD